MMPVLRPTNHPINSKDQYMSCCIDLLEEAIEVNEVIRSGWWGEGPKVAEFEQALAQRYGRKHCIAVNSCTAALHLALLAHGIGPGDEVILPALTFVSTGLAVLYVGAAPVFADVRPDSLCLDWNDVERRVNPNTKAIIPVDYAGFAAANPQALGYTRESRKLFKQAIIQDAAHSCGGLAYGDTVCLSFHPVKNLATPDGGAILTDDDDMDRRLRSLRWCGIDRNTWQRTGKRYSWDYDIAEVGYKCHWNDVAAAIGLVQLRHLDEMNEKRRSAAVYYTNYLAGLQLPADHYNHTWHLYTIRVPAELRDGLIDHLAGQGISASVHYKPLTYYPMFADQPTPPITEREWRRLVTLPLYADITQAEQETVIGAIREFMEG